LLPSPAATEPFTYLSRLGDYENKIFDIAPDWQEHLSFTLAQLIYPYKERVDILHDLDRTLSAFINNSLAGVPKADIYFRRTILPNYHPYEVGINDCLFQPSIQKKRPAFISNIEEYKKRYRVLRWDTFLSQMSFLASTLDIARSRNIRIVLVAMPITDINKQLLGNFAGDVYKKSLQVLANSKGATLIDLDSSRQFVLSDFLDTVHLHSGGGAKMLDLLATKLANDRSLIPSSALCASKSDQRL
jgi:hypothetical protein